MEPPPRAPCRHVLPWTIVLSGNPDRCRRCGERVMVQGRWLRSFVTVLVVAMGVMLVTRRSSHPLAGWFFFGAAAAGAVFAFLVVHSPLVAYDDTEQERNLHLFQFVPFIFLALALVGAAVLVYRVTS